MKTFILTIALCIAAISLAACQDSTTANRPVPPPANANFATGGNANGAVNHNGMNHNMPMNHGGTMDHSNMNHNAMMMGHSEMKSDPDAASQPYDLQFLDTMTHHHEGAISMSEMLLGKSQNEELKKFAQKIIDDQKKEIAQMKEWREKWYPGKPAAKNMEMPGMKDSAKMMSGDHMKEMDRMRGKDFDLHFLGMMIPHHQDAVTMAKDALGKAEHEEVKTLSKSIIMAQETEIKRMQDWKTQWSK